MSTKSWFWKIFSWKLSDNCQFTLFMLELYLFIFAFIAIIAIVAYRVFRVRKDDQLAFKEKVAAQVEENKKLENEEELPSFKEEHAKMAGLKSYDFAAFKEEMRKVDLALANRDYGEAKRGLIQAMALAREELPVALKLGEVYMLTEDYKRAEALYLKLIEDGHELPAVYENIGKIMLKRKAYKEAIQAYVRAVELDEKDDEKLVALGKLYFHMMRYGVAAECFRRAAEIRTRDVDYLFLLAEACIADDDFENALFTYERILTIEPYNEKAKSASQDVRIKMKEQDALFS